MNRQLTLQESRHKLARAICHGKRGQIMQAYRTGQDDQLGAFGLVLNGAVLWTIGTPPSSSHGRCPPKRASTTC